MLPGARLGQGRAGGLPLVLLGRLLRGKFLAARLPLRRQGGGPLARFVVLQTDRGRVEFDEHLTSLDVAAYHKMGRDDPAGHRRRNGMPGLSDFQPRRPGDLVQGDAGEHTPGTPGA